MGKSGSKPEKEKAETKGRGINLSKDIGKKNAPGKSDNSRIVKQLFNLLDKDGNGKLDDMKLQPLLLGQIASTIKGIQSKSYTLAEFSQLFANHSKAEISGYVKFVKTYRPPSKPTEEIWLENAKSFVAEGADGKANLDGWKYDVKCTWEEEFKGALKYAVLGAYKAATSRRFCDVPKEGKSGSYLTKQMTFALREWLGKYNDEYIVPVPLKDQEYIHFNDFWNKVFRAKFKSYIEDLVNHKDFDLNDTLAILTRANQSKKFFTRMAEEIETRVESAKARFGQMPPYYNETKVIKYKKKPYSFKAKPADAYTREGAVVSKFHTRAKHNGVELGYKCLTVTMFDDNKNVKGEFNMANRSYPEVMKFLMDVQCPIEIEWGQQEIANPDAYGYQDSGITYWQETPFVDKEQSKKTGQVIKSIKYRGEFQMAPMNVGSDGFKLGAVPADIPDELLTIGDFRFLQNTQAILAIENTSVINWEYEEIINEINKALQKKKEIKLKLGAPIDYPERMLNDLADLYANMESLTSEIIIAQNIEEIIAAELDAQEDMKSGRSKKGRSKQSNRSNRSNRSNKAQSNDVSPVPVVQENPPPLQPEVTKQEEPLAPNPEITSN